jgi:hypothetical protein
MGLLRNRPQAQKATEARAADKPIDPVAPVNDKKSGRPEE